MSEEKVGNNALVVLGPGAIGISVAAPMAVNNNNVVILGKEHHKKYFEKNPVIYKTTERTYKTHIKVIIAEELNNTITPKAIFVSLKANHTINALKALEDKIDSDVPIVSLQNGFIARDIYEKTKFKNVYASVIGFNIALEKTGVARQTSEGEIVVGKIHEKEEERTDDVPEFIVNALSASAPTKVSDNITGDVWMKALINSTINPICAIGNLKLGELPLHQSSIALASMVWRELVDVAVAKKVKINPFGGMLYPEMIYVYDIISYGITKTVMMRIVHPHKEAIVSMLQDVLAGKETEIDFLNGTIYNMGQKLGVKMPANRKIIETIKKIEKKEAKPSKGLLNKIYRDLILE